MAIISERINLIRSESESAVSSSEEELVKIYRDRSSNVHRSANANGFYSSAENDISFGRRHTIQVDDVNNNIRSTVPISDVDITKPTTLDRKTFFVLKAFVFGCLLISFIVFFLVFILVAHASANNDDEMSSDDVI